MSTLKVDKVIGSLHALPVIDGARDVEVYVATPGQTVYETTRFDNSFNIRAFVGSTEVDAKWIDTNVVELTTDGVDEGERVRIFKVGMNSEEIRMKDYEGNWTDIGKAVETLFKASKFETHNEDFVAEVGRSYWIDGDIVVTLQDSSGIPTGSTIELAKALTSTPTIKTVDGTPINVNGKAVDTTVSFDVNARLLVVFDGQAWGI